MILCRNWPQALARGGALVLTVGHCPGGSQGNAMTLAQLSAADDSTDAVADYVLSDDEGDDMLPPGHRLFGRSRAAAGGNLDDGDNDDGVMGGDFESDEVLIAARSLSLSAAGTRVLSGARAIRAACLTRMEDCSPLHVCIRCIEAVCFVSRLQSVDLCRCGCLLSPHPQCINTCTL